MRVAKRIDIENIYICGRQENILDELMCGVSTGKKRIIKEKSQRKENLRM